MTRRGPRGLDASSAFVEYMDELRSRWPADPELAAKHGVPAGNGRSATETMTETTTGETESNTNMMGRRAFCVAAGGTLALASMGAGVASAASDLNYGSDKVPNPRITGPVTIAEHRPAEMDSAIEYIADDGSIASLEDVGGQIEPEEDEETPHNPITLQADHIGAEELYAFPRGETFDSDGDGDDDSDVYALDAEHWTTDTSGTAGSLTFEDVDSPADTPALHVATSSQGSGDVALATFSEFSAITSGIDRKYLQLVATVDSLPSGTTVTIRVRDSAGNAKEVWLDADADSTQAGTVTTETGPAQAFQVQLGELSTSLDDITEVEIEVADGDADVTLTAFNLERESSWSFGVEEYTNADDEFDTRTLKEPSGTYSIRSLDSIGDSLASGPIYDLQVDVELSASGLPGDVVDYEFTSADNYDQDHRFELVYGWDLPTAYDLSWGDLSILDTVLYQGYRHLAAEFATGLDSVPTLEDVDDISWTDRQPTYEDAAIDDEITLTTSASGGQIIAWHGDILVTDDEREAIEAPSGGGGGGARGTSGAWYSGWSGALWGTVAALIGAVAMRVRKLRG